MALDVIVFGWEVMGGSGWCGGWCGGVIMMGGVGCGGWWNGREESGWDGWMVWGELADCCSCGWKDGGVCVMMGSWMAWWCGRGNVGVIVGRFGMAE